MQIDVRSNINQVILSLGEQAEKVTKAAISGALNKVAVTVRGEATKKIRERYNIKVASVKGAIDIKRATRTRLYATVSATGKRVSLLSYSGTRQVKKGVTVQIKTGGGRKLIAHAFIQTTLRGSQGVFRRVGPARYPIEFLRGPGIKQAFASQAVNTALVSTIKTRFPIEFAHELNFRNSPGPLQPGNRR